MRQMISFDYYYGMQADAYSFYRIPKVLFTNEYFKALSCEVKVLYGLMLDRMGLSIKNRWLDEEDRVYIIFTVEDAMEMLGCGNKKVIRLLDELDTKKGGDFMIIIIRILARVLLFPAWAALWLFKWFCVLLVSLSAMVLRLLAFIFLLTSIAGYTFGLESAEVTWRSLAIALGTFLIPMTAGIVLAGIEIADLWLRNILLSQYGGSLY